MKFFVCILIVFISLEVSAKRYEDTGKVLEMVSNENPSNDKGDTLGVVYVSGFGEAGNCYVANSTNHVSLRIRYNDQGKAHLTVLLAAYTSDKGVRVRVDDTNTDSSGVCYLQQLRLNTGFNE